MRRSRFLGDKRHYLTAPHDSSWSTVTPSILIVFEDSNELLPKLKVNLLAFRSALCAKQNKVCFGGVHFERISFGPIVH